MGIHDRLEYEATNSGAWSSTDISFGYCSKLQPHWKTVFDKVFAMAALLFFAPLIIVIALLIFLREGKSVIYRHSRIGAGGRPFECLKFRTMVKDADQRLTEFLAENPDAREAWLKYRKLPDDPRITCFGRFLRKSSLDELPQFLNVLRGEMSIVGPRPIMADEVREYGNDFKYYLAARPGITGLWQVNGRSNANYTRRVELDKSYAQNRSLILDLKIVAKTVKVVLLRDGSA